MSHTPVFNLLRPERVEPASKAASWLGRIVQNHAAPDAWFTPEEPSRLLIDITTSETKIADASALVNNGTAANLTLELSGLASFFQERGRQTGIQFSTTSISYIRLQNHPKALRSIVDDPSVKGELAQMLKPGGQPAYFIVGMLIWENASFADNRLTAAGVGGSVELHLAGGVSTGLSIPSINPAVELQSKRSLRRGLTGFSEGSSIFAFEYRTVRRRIYSIRSTFTPRLGGYGSRIEKDRVFGEGAQQEKELTQDEPPVEMDEEDISWVDLIDTELEVESFGGVLLAFDNHVEHGNGI
jgi:hypothetical protein